MPYATLILTDAWWLPACLILVVGLALLAWSYQRHTPGSWGWAAFALRSLALLALAACLLDPLWSRSRPKPGANLLAIIADTSQGMEIHDPGSNQSRGQELQELVNNPDGGWQAILAKTFELRRFRFDIQLQNLLSLKALSFDGRATQLGAALQQLKNRFHSRPLAGVLLFTDGNATDLTEATVGHLKELPPIFPVIMGSDRPPRDISILDTVTSQTAFEDAPVTLQAVVQANGFAGRKISARLTDSHGKELLYQEQTPTSEHQILSFRFQWKPDGTGLLFHELSVFAGEGSPMAMGAEEATVANNRRVIVVDRGEGPNRILYVAGRPNWEYKFLHRAVEDDPQLEMVGLIRIARREAKFDFRGRAGESSNPLFRGFENPGAGELERFDQPVLKRLNTRNELELAAGFPGTAEELYEYRGIILDDVEAGFFTIDQSSLVQKFVSERGGGLLMLGGMESFREGNYQRTPIGDMLPVYLDRENESPTKGPYQFQLTREGLLQEWARLRPNETDERARLESMPGFLIVNSARNAKPGASVLATVAGSDGTSLPALVAQRFGRGRSAALTIGDFWRWGQQGPKAHDDLDKSWRQLLRWLVADVPRRVELSVEPDPEQSSGAVRLQVRARDSKFRPVDNAQVTLEIQPRLLKSGESGPTNAVRITADASATEAGLYEARFIPRVTAGYQAIAIVTNAFGAEIERAHVGWNSDLAADEFRNLTPNRALLERLARQTGGRVISPAELSSFARTLPDQSAPIMETGSQPLWHNPWWFGFALSCLLGEWGIRRWKGMA